MSAAFESLTLEGLAALTALVITCLSGLCGAAWWASAIYWRVGQLVHELKTMNATLATYKSDQDRINKELWGEIGDHGERITKVETKVGL